MHGNCFKKTNATAQAKVLVGICTGEKDSALSSAGGLQGDASSSLRSRTRGDTLGPASHTLETLRQRLPGPAQLAHGPHACFPTLGAKLKAVCLCLPLADLSTAHSSSSSTFQKQSRQNTCLGQPHSRLRGGRCSDLSSVQTQEARHGCFPSSHQKSPPEGYGCLGPASLQQLPFPMLGVKFPQPGRPAQYSLGEPKTGVPLILFHGGRAESGKGRKRWSGLKLSNFRNRQGLAQGLYPVLLEAALS